MHCHTVLIPIMGNISLQSSEETDLSTWIGFDPIILASTWEGLLGLTIGFAVAGLVFAIGLVIAGLVGWTPEEVSARFKASGIRSASRHFAKCVLFYWLITLLCIAACWGTFVAITSLVG